MRKNTLYMTVCTVSSKLLILLQTKLGFMSHHYRLECLVKKGKRDCWVQSRDHSEISKYQWIFVLTISSKAIIKLHMVMHHYKPECQVKNWFVSSRWRSQQRLIWFKKQQQFWLNFLDSWSFCNRTWFDGVNSIISLSVTGLLRSRSRSQWRLKMSMNLCPNDIFWTTERFITKLRMVIHNEALEYVVNTKPGAGLCHDVMIPSSPLKHLRLYHDAIFPDVSSNDTIISMET